LVTGTIMFCWLINVKVKDIKQRNHLRKIWRDDQANELARKINWLICDIRAKQNLSELCPCKLWSAVRDSGGRPRRSVDYLGHIFYEIEDVNFYFTQVCGDCYYSVSDVEYFRKQVSNNSAECGFLMFMRLNVCLVNWNPHLSDLVIDLGGFITTIRMKSVTY